MDSNERPIEETGAAEAEAATGLPPWLARSFAWTWRAVSGTKTGLAAFIVLIYVIPYALLITAFTTQAIDGGSFPVVAFAALFVASLVAAQPAPTPLVGTAAMFLAGVLGANFEPLAVGLLAGVGQTLGLTIGYGIGAAGLAPLLIERFGSRPRVRQAIDRGADVIRRRGAKAMLVLAAIPNPIRNFAAVFAGSSGTRFLPIVGASFVGSTARFLVFAYLGYAIFD